MNQEQVHHTARSPLHSYTLILWNSIKNSFMRPKEFFIGWGLDATHFVITILFFTLYSNYMGNSLQQLVALNQAVMTGAIEQAGSAATGLRLFVIRAIFFFILLVALYIFSYTITKKITLQSIYHKKIPFGRFFWLNTTWIILWIIIALTHIYAIIPAVLPLIQFLYSLNYYIGMITYYALFILPIIAYLHFTLYLHQSFFEHHTIKNAYKGMLASILYIHKIIPSYVIAGVIIFILGYIIPYLQNKNESIQWFLVLAIIIAPWTSWLRVHTHELIKNHVAR